MAEETKKKEEGLTLKISVGLRPGVLAGYGSFIAGKENPKKIDFREEVNNNHKK